METALHNVTNTTTAHVSMEAAAPIEAILKNARCTNNGSIMNKMTAMSTLWQAPSIERENSSLQDYAKYAVACHALEGR
eukprot:6208689-Amphidinium_carterae.1